jgi:hypothetical protein
MPTCKLRTVIEIGTRCPHELMVDPDGGAESSDGGGTVVYSAAVDSWDAQVAPGIGALTRYRLRQPRQALE